MKNAPPHIQQTIQLNYLNKALGIGMVDWREVYLLHPAAEQLQVEYYRGKLVYRKKGSTKRYYYSVLKRGLEKTKEQIVQYVIPDKYWTRLFK